MTSTLICALTLLWPTRHSNIKDWWSESLAEDVRWQYGTPPKGNANFPSIQHMLHHLAPTGSMALLLANGSMSSNTNNEGEIRKPLVEDT